jgi:Cu(I)/Ag(I) efflux system membrane fusion protein
LVLILASVIGLACSREQAADRQEAVTPGETQAKTGGEAIHGEELTQQWTCPMHPEVISDMPGQCPDCNMDLVPMQSDAPEEWVCECCPEVRSNEPGVCPTCNMNLIPAEPGEGNGHDHEMDGNHPGGATQNGQWTCPMHPEVISDEPGQCPDCNMDLVPMEKHHDRTGAVGSTEGTQHAGHGQVSEWTCGMHPAIRSEEPGKCPICNMDLVPVTGGDTDAVTISQEMLDVVGADHATVQYLPLAKVITAVGRVEYDERLVRHVASRVPGRVEKLYADFAGVEVSRGEPLLAIYSPELITALEEYRTASAAARRGTSGGAVATGTGLKALAEAAKTRLRLWGLDDREITEAAGSGPDDAYTVLIRSPISGTVTEKKVFEGKYVKEGEGLYVVADLSRVWVTGDVYEDDIAHVSEGDMVMAVATAYPKEMFHGKVAFVDPFIDRKTRAARVRLEIANPDQKLKPGMFVETTLEIPVSREERDFWTCPMHPDVIESGPGECPDCGMFLEKVTGGQALGVPRDAVVFAGDLPVVYVERSAGTYEPRPVVIGEVASVPGSEGLHYHILDGLTVGERVITDASFLIHSQARLTGKAASAYGGALQVDAPGHRH